ncbi:hypothetical protein Pan216_23970 [Planctomycetes bacterium Pan216]|uniref:UDP-2,4-diacetamido-2,4, 6-trideoxy-beta-L-altropyranose hydrolase n=1 Tax=Kolteria novifilia TaxID=2527975 RepID=A0A518B3P0_9BACT|nr:hypothetical protein Pan216_23970 [Planctomycetes bacterium Pan216]
MMHDQPLSRVLFICRGSTDVGLGHVIRSRTIAFEMARRTSVRVVVIGDEYVDALLAGRGLTYQIVDDEPGVIAAIDAYDPDIVVFDLIELSKKLYQRVSRRCMTVSVSPIFDHLTSTDLFFHRTRCQGSDWDLERFDGEVRSGLEYAVVREQCVKISAAQYEQNINQQPMAVAISMGGSDAGNKTLEVLRSIKSLPRRMLFWVLLGEGYGHSYEALVDCVKRDTQHEIILAKTSDSMWRVMSSCALAILAGGTVTYEAVFAGLPSINIFEKPEHVFLVRELVERGTCLTAGFPLNAAIDVATANLLHLEQHREELVAMHRACDGLMDRRGAARIAQEILECHWQRTQTIRAEPLLARQRVV